ncbi:hypothetical protein [Paenibacillus sp. Marseille-Q4541]|uniref:hypothetical protein n=1 Tax=Paenibacillus sp. Marseille-Q4541 TaxID=2831522 RepID=UPI001BA6921A|nr:hypothetical protein [Paenibacillus sp. Marseille-Q4541]
MFDPTVFDNLKVALENELYDMDNLDHSVRITGRVDRIELAVMSRMFRIQFQLPELDSITTEIELEASLQELASEILEQQGAQPGCILRIRYQMPIQHVEEECSQIQQVIEEIWPAQTLTQTISYVYDKEKMSTLLNTIEITFPRKINEEQMNDLPELVQFVVHTAQRLGSA